MFFKRNSALQTSFDWPVLRQPGLLFEGNFVYDSLKFLLRTVRQPGLLSQGDLEYDSFQCLLRSSLVCSLNCVYTNVTIFLLFKDIFAILKVCVQLAATMIFFFGGNSMISSLAFGVWLCSIQVFIINVFACPFNVCSAVLLFFQLLVATIMVIEVSPFRSDLSSPRLSVIKRVSV